LDEVVFVKTDMGSPFLLLPLLEIVTPEATVRLAPVLIFNGLLLAPSQPELIIRLEVSVAPLLQTAALAVTAARENKAATANVEIFLFTLQLSLVIRLLIKLLLVYDDER
jgi:hypothetical protein